MLQTTNYNLKKIELTDSPPDITVINPNWDVIDTELNSHEEQINSLVPESVARTIYVDLAYGSDTTGEGTIDKPFKTIGKAVSTVNKILYRDITITVLAGDSGEDLDISGFSGFASLRIIGGNALSNSYIVNSIAIVGCSSKILIQGINEKSTAVACIDIQNSTQVILSYIKVPLAASNPGVKAFTSNVIIENSEISNRNIGILANSLSNILSNNNIGYSNAIGLQANAGVIRKNGTQPTGSTAESMIAGGQIL